MWSIHRKGIVKCNSSSIQVLTFYLFDDAIIKKIHLPFFSVVIERMRARNQRLREHTKRHGITIISVMILVLMEMMTIIGVRFK